MFFKPETTDGVSRIYHAAHGMRLSRITHFLTIHFIIGIIHVKRIFCKVSHRQLQKNPGSWAVNRCGRRNIPLKTPSNQMLPKSTVG